MPTRTKRLPLPTRVYGRDDDPDLPIINGWIEEWGRDRRQLEAAELRLETADRERIVGPALRVHGVTLSLPSPARHHDVVHIMVGKLNIPQEGTVQGFLTSGGRFVDRIEAAHVASAAGQLLPRALRLPSGLYSEDVW